MAVLIKKGIFMDCKETLIAWLNNAYSMELSLAETLERHADALEDDLPEIRQELEKHVEETREQADRVKAEIERLGGEVSGIKAGMAKIFGELSGLSTDLAKDKIVKNAIAEHAAEHFEMASYMSIAVLAEKCGEEETAKMAREIAEEEKETGEKLEQKFETIIDHFITEEKIEEE